jgi:hypothetical protein
MPHPEYERAELVHLCTVITRSSRAESALGCVCRAVGAVNAVTERDCLSVLSYGEVLFSCWGLAGPVSGSQPDPGGASWPPRPRQLP